MKVRRAQTKVHTRKRELSQKEQIRLLAQETKLLQLKSDGYTRNEIARELDVDAATVDRIWEKSYREFIGDRDKLRDTKLAEIMAGHENMIKKWSKKAQTNAAAAHIVLRARREISKMCGHGNNNRIEHVGGGGGPIVTVNATPMEAARLVREAFGGKVLPFTGMPKALTPDADADDGKATG